MYKTLILNVDELWLKGKNRPSYFKAMKNHVSVILKHFHGEKNYKIRNESQRFVVTSEEEFSNETITALQKAPGLNSLSGAIKIATDKEAILPAVFKEIKRMGDTPKTFKVQCKRVDKTFPEKSMDLNRYIGHFTLKEFSHLKVDVHNPDFVIDVKILHGGIYITTSKLTGVGGLPVGTSGHLITMISGGFDSPVASYLMSKRGCKQTLIFFYAYPYVGEEVKDKIIDISKHLAKYQRGMDLYVVPFGKVQNLISKDCREEYRTILFRKFMVETSNLLADKIGAGALLTGDALGQVSSQTIGNMSAVDKSSRRLIMRPLVGMNKIEIINLAKEIGTHDLSVIPHDDACSMFAPKHPVITPDLDYWDDFCKNHDYTSQLQECLDEAEVFRLGVKGNIFESR